MGRKFYSARTPYQELGPTIEVDHYVRMIDRGGCRMGTDVSFPNNSRACCVHYAIRCVASEYQPTKDQAKTLRKRCALLQASPDGGKEPSAESVKEPKSRKRKNSWVGLLMLSEDSRRTLGVRLIAEIRRLQAEGALIGPSLGADALSDPLSLVRDVRIRQTRGGEPPAKQRRGAGTPPTRTATDPDKGSPATWLVSSLAFILAGRMSQRTPDTPEGCSTREAAAAVAQLLVQRLQFGDVPVKRVELHPPAVLHLLWEGPVEEERPREQQGETEERGGGGEGGGGVAAGAGAPEILPIPPQGAAGEADDADDGEEEEDGEDEGGGRDRWRGVHGVDEPKYSSGIDRRKRVRRQQVERRRPRSRLSVTLRPVEPSREGFAMYEAFNIIVHGKQPGSNSYSGYADFIGGSCLRRRPLRDAERRLPVGAAPRLEPMDSAHPLTRFLGDLGGPAQAGYDLAQGFGTFQAEYRDDEGTLVALGVLDILPNQICSHYFMYDPAYRWLELGKLSSLWEIQWVRLAQQYCPSLQYYNTCMWIPPPCEQMAYKVNYQPCELLCPFTWRWVLYDDRVREAIEHAPKKLALIARGVTAADLRVQQQRERSRAWELLNDEENRLRVRCSDAAREILLDDPRVAPSVWDTLGRDKLLDWIQIVGSDNARCFEADVTEYLGSDRDQLEQIKQSYLRPPPTIDDELAAILAGVERDPAISADERDAFLAEIQQALLDSWGRPPLSDGDDDGNDAEDDDLGEGGGGGDGGPSRP